MSYELQRHEAARRLTEEFWSAVKARDAAAAGSLGRERAARIADRLGRLMVDFDQRGQIPDGDELDALDGEPWLDQGVG